MDHVEQYKKAASGADEKTETIQICEYNQLL